VAALRTIGRSAAPWRCASWIMLLLSDCEVEDSSFSEDWGPYSATSTAAAWRKLEWRRSGAMVWRFTTPPPSREPYRTRPEHICWLDCLLKQKESGTRSIAKNRASRAQVR